MRFTLHHLVMCIGSAVVLSSCAVGNTYKRPHLDTPAHYRQLVNVTGDTVLLPWRTFFKDPNLIALIDQALERNKDITVAMLNLEQLDLAYRQAKLGLLPNVDLNIGASRVYQSKNSLNGSLSEQFTGEKYLDDFSATLLLSWEADIWGKAKLRKDVAHANYFAQHENLSALKTRIVVQVAQAYYNLVTLDEQLKVAQENILLSDSTLTMIQLQFQSAQVNSLGVEQAEAQKKTAELLVPLAKQHIAVQENALSILCGAYPDQIVRSPGLEGYKLDEPFAVGLPAHLLSRRPDVKAAEYAVVVANANIGLSKAAMYPTFSLSPSIGVNSFKFNNWFDLPGALVKNLAGNIAQPVFQKRALKTNYEISKIERQKSAEQFRLSVMTAVGEVSDALVKSKYATERMVLVEQKRTSLKKAQNDALLLYKSGMATYLEVILAQNNALQNDLEAISIHKEKYDAVTELYRALGGGVQ